MINVLFWSAHAVYWLSVCDISKSYSSNLVRLRFSMKEMGAQAISNGQIVSCTFAVRFYFSCSLFLQDFSYSVLSYGGLSLSAKTVLMRFAEIYCD